MYWIKRIVSYAITIGVVYALIVIAPTFSRMRVATMYDDIENFDATKGLNAEAKPPISRFNPGDGIVFKLWQPTGEDPDVFLGWAAGFPGDEVEVRGGKILVNGKPVPRGADINAPSTPPVTVPANHIFVTSSRHRFDSIGFGPIPQAAILGRVRDLP